MSFRPLYTRDRLWAILAVMVMLAVALLTATAIFKRPVGPPTVVLIGGLLLLMAAVVVLLYRLWALHTIDYWVERDAIHIHWRGEEAIVPLPEIQQIRPTYLKMRPSWRHWPLQWMHSGQQHEHLVSYATQPPERCLAIETAGVTFIISPQEPEAFLTAYEQRRAFGPARQLKQVIYLAPWRQHWFLNDRLAQGLLFGGLLLGLLVLAYTMWRFPQLPETIAMHFNARGEPDLLSPRRAIFLLPGIALLSGFLNAAIGIALYEYQRFFSYILWSVSIILQGAFLFIVANLINLAVGG
jgi:hypothetical protein